MYKIIKIIKLVLQKNDAQNGGVYKYLQKNNEQRTKLKILINDGIKKYKTFKEYLPIQNNGLIVIDTSRTEGVKKSDMNLV